MFGRKKRKKLPLITKIGLGFIFGLLFGLIAGYFSDYSIFSNWVIPILRLVGNIFIALLKMLIVPLVLTSIIMGASSIGDPSKLGRIGGKTIAIYLLTSVVAVAIGLIFGNFIRPGIGISLEGAAVTKVASESIFDVIYNIFPSNPIKAIVDQQMLQIIVFALFIGIAAALTGGKASHFLDFNTSLAEIMFKITDIVMMFAPYGIFALISTTAAEYGTSVLGPFLKVIFAIYAASFVQLAVVYSSLIAGYVRKNPLWFFKGVQEAMLSAFVTRSSAAVLPVSMDNVCRNLGVKEEIASFVLPLGSTINMNGTAIYEGVCALFIAQAYGIDLTLISQIQIILTATLAAVGTAGVPGSGLIMLSMVLTSAGLPVDGIALVAGIDAVLDMARTLLNVTGDMCAAVLVAKSEGEKF
ncbi:MAG: dicarboxylate/amino acid:cation symporter [Synergistes sp.]|nr:dicarboxylate/amino acid:cation symporter [Synergistes sp.]